MLTPVKHADFMTVLEKAPHESLSNEQGSADDQHSHLILRWRVSARCLHGDGKPEGILRPRQDYELHPNRSRNRTHRQTVVFFPLTAVM
jgi:hypothetical protein